MKKDLETTEDIELLVNSFYAKVQQDEVIGYIFSEVMAVDWEHHLPRMYSFWGSVLLGKGSFKGNPMLKHIDINAQEPFTDAHFERWIMLWEQTLQELFSGENATNALLRARSIKDLMQYKIGQISAMTAKKTH